MFAFLKTFHKSVYAFKFIIFLLSFSVLINLQLFSHGINSNIINNGIGIKAAYDDTSPMSFAETKVFSPDKKDIPFQEGFTDRNGCFVFVPDKIGTWKIIINDGMGHGVIKKIKIKDLKAFTMADTRTFSRWYKILIGLSFIFGLTGIISYYQAKKNIKGKQKNAHS